MKISYFFLSTVETIENVFAFNYRAEKRKKRLLEETRTFDEWRCYNPVKEYYRMGITSYNSNW